MDFDTVSNYYDECGPVEWDRLEHPAYNTVELLVTIHYLEKYLPPKGTVLEIGGGDGVYAIELAKRGYEVILLDPCPDNIAAARKEIEKQPKDIQDRVIGYVEGCSEGLRMYPDNRFDAVLCLGGSMSQMIESEDREHAASEFARVCKDGSPVFVNVLSYYGALRRVLAEHPEDIKHLPDFLESRRFPGRSGSQDCYFFTPEEMVDVLARNGIEVVEYVGAQGLSAQMKDVTEECSKDPVAWEIWKKVLIDTCNHPSVVGVSDHILAVGYAWSG
jgi:ubiquinone/menaquinone biosynthesis C-methylase UbiE